MSKCNICGGVGFVLYHQQKWNISYEFLAYCICENGKEWNKDGREMKGANRSKYYTESIEKTLAVDFLKKQNKEDAEKISSPSDLVRQVENISFSM